MPGGAGIARALVRHQVQQLAARNVARLFLEVASLNMAARQLYAASGFKEAALRKAYYENDDAIVMRLELKLEPHKAPADPDHLRGRDAAADAPPAALPLDLPSMAKRFPMHYHRMVLRILG